MLWLCFVALCIHVDRMKSKTHVISVPQGEYHPPVSLYTHIVVCAVFPCTHMYQSLQHTQTIFSEYVCEVGVTECLNYGLIVSLAGFCCCHHIGPVKVNYWNMFICCQPLPQAVTCMETQTNTHRRCSLK